MFSTVAFGVHLLDSAPELELPMAVPADDTTGRGEKNLFSDLEVIGLVLQTDHLAQQGQVGPSPHHFPSRCRKKIHKPEQEYRLTRTFGWLSRCDCCRQRYQGQLENKASNIAYRSTTIPSDCVETEMNWFMV